MVHHFARSANQRRSTSGTLHFLNPADRHSHSDAGEWQEVRKEEEPRDKNTQGCLGIMSGVCVTGGQKHSGRCGVPPFSCLHQGTLLMSLFIWSVTLTPSERRHFLRWAAAKLQLFLRRCPSIPSPPLHRRTSVTLSSVRRNRRQTKACWHSLTPTREAAAMARGKKSWGGQAYQMCRLMS